MQYTNSMMSSHLYLPPEVWSITLENLRELQGQDELTYLWTVVRLVCRQFKEVIEEIFRTEHLPKTWLYLDSCKWIISLIIRETTVGRSGLKSYRNYPVLLFTFISLVHYKLKADGILLLKSFRMPTHMLHRMQSLLLGKDHSSRASN